MKTSLAIDVQNLSKRYFLKKNKPDYRTFNEAFSSFFSFKKNKEKQELWALKNVNFQVKQGEAVAIIGSNGSGKSTLLKILSKITEPTAGRAIIHGRMGSLLEVGTGFHPELTGKENIFLNGAILGMRHQEIKKQFDAIVDFSGVEKFLATPVKFYSSGMRVRLAFSVAAHLNPEILVVDEVLAVGDASFQQKCLGKMEDVKRSGRTVLFVSHQLAAVRFLCQKAILLNKGVIEATGSVEHVVNTYQLHFLSSKAKTIWSQEERPSSDFMCLEKITLLNSFNKETDTVFMSEEYRVEIAFEVFLEGSYAAFSLSFLREEGEIVFESLSNQEDRYYGKPLKKGKYAISCLLHKNFFNQGKFIVNLTCYGQNWQKAFIIENALIFNAVDDGKLKKDYFKDIQGAIYPLLNWEMT
jgi:lipopolysaccharide transport system ATP-binding protein